MFVSGENAPETGCLILCVTVCCETVPPLLECYIESDHFQKGQRMPNTQVFGLDPIAQPQGAGSLQVYIPVHSPTPCARFRPFLTVPVQKLAGYEHHQRKERRIFQLRHCRSFGKNHYICVSMVQFCHTIVTRYPSTGGAINR